jgi:2-epi-5-epi-valiolone 7-phosphate 2-epimerase
VRDDVAIGVTAWTVDGRGPETIASAAALGFTAIHLDSGHPGTDLCLEDPAVRDAYRQAASDTGVRITAIAGGGLNDLGLTSPVGSPAAEGAWRSIRIAIDSAVDLGVPLVFLPSFRNGEIKTAAGLHRTAEVLAAACDYAAGRVTVATENTLDVAGHLELVRAADRPELRVLFDTQNPALWGHRPAAMVAPLWPLLADQVHVKDGAGGRFGDTLLGEGEAGFLETAEELRAHGFCGTLISENEYAGDRRVNAARDLAFLDRAFALSG